MENHFIQTLQMSFLAQGENSSQGMGSMLIFYLLLFAGLWFLLLAPQKKRQKEHKKMLTELKTGDTVLTSGGIYGEITNVKEDRFVVRIAENTKVEVSKGSIQNSVPRK